MENMKHLFSGSLTFAYIQTMEGQQYKCAQTRTYRNATAALATTTATTKASGSTRTIPLKERRESLQRIQTANATMQRGLVGDNTQRWHSGVQTLVLQETVLVVATVQHARPGNSEFSQKFKQKCGQGNYGRPGFEVNNCLLQKLPP